MAHGALKSNAPDEHIGYGGFFDSIFELIDCHIGPEMTADDIPNAPETYAGKITLIFSVFLPIFSEFLRMQARYRYNIPYNCTNGPKYQ